MAIVKGPKHKEKETSAIGVNSSITGKKWIVRDVDERMALMLSQRFSLPEIVGRVLANRGVNIESAKQFLNPSLRECLPDPNCLIDMETAVNRILNAILNSESIAVFGDYDVDGASSAALLSKYFLSLELKVHPYKIKSFVLGGHGDTMVPLVRYCTVAGIPIEQLIPKERIEEIVERTKGAGGEVVALLKTGSAFVSPALSAIEMAESYLKDKKRVIPCASLCQGEFGIDGYFIGVPTVIGADGVERILEFELHNHEKEALNNTLVAVQKTVSETGL